MIGIGTDILELDRLEGTLLTRVAEYFLTPAEMVEYHTRRDKLAYVASRFAAKEAVIKAFPERLSPHDFLIHKAGTKPTVIFLKPAHRKYRVLVSLSHSTRYVVGFAAVYDA